MAVDDVLWNKSFSALDPAALPSWPCPKCGETSVVLDKETLIYKPNKAQYDPSSFSKEDFEINTWLGAITTLVTSFEKMQWVQHKFVGFLICSACGESIAFGGRAEVHKETANRAFYLTPKLYPEYFSPPLPFFTFYPQYPSSVRQNFTRSFGLVFNDAASAANAIRQGIESILDELGVAKSEPKKRSLSLYDRIEKFSETNEACAEMLDGIRFLGNEGSHSGKVTREDVIAAFRVIDHVLDEVFVRSEVRKKALESSRDIAKTYRPKN